VPAIGLSLTIEGLRPFTPSNDLDADHFSDVLSFRVLTDCPRQRLPIATDSGCTIAPPFLSRAPSEAWCSLNRCDRLAPTRARIG